MTRPSPAPVGGAPVVGGWLSHWQPGAHAGGAHCEGLEHAIVGPVGGSHRGRREVHWMQTMHHRLRVPWLAYELGRLNRVHIGREARPLLARLWWRGRESQRGYVRVQANVWRRWTRRAGKRHLRRAWRFVWRRPAEPRILAARGEQHGAQIGPALRLWRLLLLVPVLTIRRGHAMLREGRPGWRAVGHDTGWYDAGWRPAGWCR